MSETEEYYPNIDAVAFCEMIDQTGRCNKLEIDTTVFYIIKGEGNSHRRTFSFRTNSFIDFYYATKWAYRLKFLDQLMTWLRENRDWNDGAYA